MAGSININQNNNDITIQDQNGKLTITDNNTGTITNVTQPVTDVVTVASLGPAGPAGAIPSTGSFATTGSNAFNGNQVITGSLTVSGSSTLTNIGPAIFSGSLIVTQGITGSLSGSVTTALTASYVQTAQTASYVLQAVSSSFATTASYALSASFAPSTPSFPFTGSAGITGSLTVVGSTTSTQIGAGAAPSGSIRLDVRAQGALSTDIGLRVRNSTDTYNILAVNGDSSVQIGSDTLSTSKLTIGSTNTSTLNLDTSYSTDTATISVARRISPTYNTNTLLFTQNAFSDGNVQPYKFHFVNPSTYWGYTEAGFSMIREAGFMFFKDSATAANLQMKLTPDNVLTMYTGSLGAVAVPTEVPVTGSAFQLFASSSNNTIIPVFIPKDGKRIQLYAQAAVTSSQGLADALTNLGFLTGSSTIATSSAFPFTGSALITGSLGVTGSASILAYTGSTATIFNVRNSANTLDIIKANGRGDAFIGQGAGRLTTGVSNTFMGLNAGSANITGQENTAIGASAGQSSLGSYNTYLGNGAGLNGTTTEGSIFIGYYAGQNSNANYAVLIGYTAGTTAGNGSVAIGYNAGPGTGVHNLSIGQSAGVGMTTGAINMHLGYRTVGSGVTTGNYNTLVGGEIVVGNVSNNAVLADMQGNIAIRKNASHLVGIGYGGTDTLGAKLDIKAQGALSTDLAFRVRNSGDTANILSVNGDGTQTWFRPANNALSTIKSDTYNLIQWSNEAFGNIAIGYITGSLNLFTPTAGYNTLIGAGNVVSSSISGVVRVGYAGSTSANYAINIGHGGRSSGVNSIRIGFHTGASSFGGTNSIHMGTTPSGNDILADNVFMTYFNSQNPSTVARVNGSFGLLGQQSTILQNGTGLYGTDTHMGNGGNTLVVATHPSPPSSSITTAFQLYASTGSLTSNIRPHFRTSNGTIVWLGDESRLFNVTASSITSSFTGSLLGTASYALTVETTSQTITSSASVTITSGTDLFAIISQSQALTLNNPTGTWSQGKDLMIRIKDNGVSQSISYDTKFRAIGVTLPTTTTANKTTYIGCLYNLSDDKFDVLGATTES